MSWPIRMLLRISPFVFLAHLYVAWSFARALSHFWSPGRWLQVPVVLLGNALPLIVILQWRLQGKVSLMGIDPPLTWQDFLIVFPYWILLIVVMEVVPYYLVLDLLHPVLKRVDFFATSAHPRLLPGIKVALYLMFLIWVPVKSYLDTYRVQVRKVSLPSNQAKGSSASPQVRLVFLSDLQVDRYTGEQKLAVLQRALDGLEGDLLLFSGDAVTYGVRFVPRALEFLCDQKARLGKVACLGDHDLWSGPRRIASGLKRCGWRFLDNQHTLFRFQNRRILVTGLTHLYGRPLSARRARQIVARAPKADLKILLVHQPGPHIIQIAKEAGYHLLLAGHTHGGQLVFHPFGKAVALSTLENRFYRGRRKFGHLNAIITNGVGLTLAPIRYGAPAEVLMIEWSFP